MLLTDGDGGAQPCPLAYNRQQHGAVLTIAVAQHVLVDNTRQLVGVLGELFIAKQVDVADIPHPVPHEIKNRLRPLDDVGVLCGYLLPQAVGDIGILPQTLEGDNGAKIGRGQLVKTVLAERARTAYRPVVVELTLNRVEPLRRRRPGVASSRQPTQEDED